MKRDSQAWHHARSGVYISNQLSLSISAESRLRRLVGAGNVYTPVTADYDGDAHTPANETADFVSLNLAAPA